MYLFQWFARAIRDPKFYEDELVVLIGLLMKNSDSRINDVQLFEYEHNSLTFAMCVLFGIRQFNVNVTVKPSLNTLIHVAICSNPDVSDLPTPVRRLAENSLYASLTTVCERESFNCGEFKL